MLYTDTDQLLAIEECDSTRPRRMQRLNKFDRNHPLHLLSTLEPSFVLEFRRLRVF